MSDTLFRTIPLAALALVGSTLQAADWKPAAGPLMTRWAKDISPDKVHPEYPRPQLVRKEWTNLNGLWDYAITARDAGQPTAYEGKILVPFPLESALSGVMKRIDDKSRLWYHRAFAAPKDLGDRRLLLHFGAVDWEATVWVNGKELGSHRGGYDGFSLDVTEALKKDGEQELVVAVWDPTSSGTQPRGKQVNKPGGIYYTPTTGIWQTVWLEPVPKKHIKGLKIVPRLRDATFDVWVTGPESEYGTDDHLRITIKGPGKVPHHANLLAPGRKEPVEVRLQEKLSLWSPEDPYLYEVEVMLYQASEGAPNYKVYDQVTSYAGMREISIGKDDQGVTRMLLNGRPYFQVGPLDQGFWPDGLYTAPTDEALKYDIEVTKKLGFNMARKHVKVEPERWYYWCDKLGLLVWQDMPSGDRDVPRGKGEIQRSPESAKDYEHELLRMIDARGNHPCIVMWVPFNEGWGQFDTERIAKLVKQHDPSRLVDPASGWNDYPCGDVHDVHDYHPQPNAPAPEEKRASVLGEFGGLGLKIDGHTWENKTWGYQGMKNTEELTRKYENLMRRVYELKDKPGISGAVYTQTTDVETEGNGLMTYDRAVIKMDVERVKAANKGDFSRAPRETGK